MYMKKPKWWIVRLVYFDLLFMHVYFKLVDFNLCVEQPLILETAKDFKFFNTQVRRRLHMFPMGKRMSPLSFRGRVIVHPPSVSSLWQTFSEISIEGISDTKTCFSTYNTSCPRHSIVEFSNSWFNSVLQGMIFFITFSNSSCKLNIMNSTEKIFVFIRKIDSHN